MKSMKKLSQILNLALLIAMVIGLYFAVDNYEQKHFLQYVMNGLGFFAAFCILACFKFMMWYEENQERMDLGDAFLHHYQTEPK